MNGDRQTDVEHELAIMRAAGMTPEQVETAGVAALKVATETAIPFIDALHALAQAATEAAGQTRSLVGALGKQRLDISGTAARQERRRLERAAAKTARKQAAQ